MKNIIVLGGGFAGLWSAVGAMRALDKLGLCDQAQVTLVNRDPYHTIRVRLYESDLSPVRIPLVDILEPIDVHLEVADVSSINKDKQTVNVSTGNGTKELSYDRLVLGTGSQLFRPELDGLRDFAFDIDTFQAATRLNDHLKSLPEKPDAPGRFTVIVIGAGLTGLELTCELPQRLKSIAKENAQLVKVIIADHNDHIGSNMGDEACSIIKEVLPELGVESMIGARVERISAEGAVINGKLVPAATVVWTAGMRANPLANTFPGTHDRFGRLPVNEFLQIEGAGNVFAAGDIACAKVDQDHDSVMSCQHGRPMGRFAGYNVVSHLFDKPMLPFKVPYYVTILDLGPWGAIYTEGWQRHVIAKGLRAKQTKEQINCHRIYPPLNRVRQDILDAAAPEIQTAPSLAH